MKKFLLSVFLILQVAASAFAAEDRVCYKSFYKNRNTECIDTLIRDVKGSEARVMKNPRSNSTMVGILASIFSTSQKEKRYILDKESTDFQKIVYTDALSVAGLLKEAEDYADKNKFDNPFKIYKIRTLESVRPIDPGDNDLLIGAYMASGDTKYIKRILDVYKSADDEMATIAFRMALMAHEFGPTLAPEGREVVMFDAILKKYKKT